MRFSVSYYSSKLTQHFCKGKSLILIYENKGLPWQSSDYDSTLPLLRVQSLVRELRSCKPSGVAKQYRYTHINTYMCAVLSRSVVSTSFQPHGLQPPGSSVHGDSPGKNTRLGCHALLQGIFPTQGSNPGLPHCRRILYQLSYHGSPYTCIYTHKHMYIHIYI